jgi:hypothetical protein
MLSALFFDFVRRFCRTPNIKLDSIAYEWQSTIESLLLSVYMLSETALIAKSSGIQPDQVPIKSHRPANFTASIL